MRLSAGWFGCHYPDSEHIYLIIERFFFKVEFPFRNYLHIDESGSFQEFRVFVFGKRLDNMGCPGFSFRDGPPCAIQAETMGTALIAFRA